MARDFTKNTGNYLSLGANALGSQLNGASAISFHAWVNGDSFGTGANENRILNVLISSVAQTGATFNVQDVSGTKRLRVGGRSVSSDSFQTRTGSTTAISTGVRYSLGGVLNIAGDSIRGYINGAQEFSGAATFGNATYTNGTPTGHDSIGAAFNGSSPSGTAEQFDGSIAEVCIWNIDIGTQGFASLYGGARPWSVRPGSLKFYMPLYGTGSPEPDYSGNAKHGTITGSLPVLDHPPVAPAWGSDYGWDGAFTVAAGQPYIKRVGGVPFMRPAGARVW